MYKLAQKSSKSCKKKTHCMWYVCLFDANFPPPMATLGTAAATPKKVAIVTGSNTGLGKETAWQLLHQYDFRLVFACRSEERAKNAMKELAERCASLGKPPLETQQTFIPLDLSSLTSVEAFVDSFCASFDRLDVLLNNAGVIMTEYAEDKLDLEIMFSTNHLGHFHLTNLLLPLLKASGTKDQSSRIVILSSGGHRSTSITIEDIKKKSHPLKEKPGDYDAAMDGYGFTKLCNLWHTSALSARLEEEKVPVVVNAVRPGAIDTDIWRYMNNTDRGKTYIRQLKEKYKFEFISTEEGVRTQVFLATSKRVEGASGKYWYNCEELLPSERAQDKEAAQHLWDYSKECVQQFKITVDTL